MISGCIWQDGVAPRISNGVKFRFRVEQGRTTVDDIKPALPIIRNVPYFPLSRVLKVMQDLYNQQ